MFGGTLDWNKLLLLCGFSWLTLLDFYVMSWPRTIRTVGQNSLLYQRHWAKTIGDFVERNLYNMSLKLMQNEDPISSTRLLRDRVCFSLSLFFLCGSDGAKHTVCV
jgi:hypothetical protein